MRLGNRKILKGISITNLAKAMIGEMIERSWRHGKLLFAALDKGKRLALHFGMTGSLAYFKDLDDNPRHDRLRLDLDNEHHLAFVDQRMLGRVGLTSDPETYVGESGLGPDALAISKSKKAFADLFGGRRGQSRPHSWTRALSPELAISISTRFCFRRACIPGRGSSGWTPKQLQCFAASHERF